MKVGRESRTYHTCNNIKHVPSLFSSMRSLGTRLVSQATPFTERKGVACEIRYKATALALPHANPSKVQSAEVGVVS